MVALALLAANAASASEAACERALLEELGWRFLAADAAQPRIDAGTPCERTSIADAQARGGLRVEVPADASSATIDALHRELLAHPATTCAYAFKLGDATRRAVDRLAANPGYRFSGLQAGWIGFGLFGGAARDGWRPIAGFGRGYVPRDRNSGAINAFYSGNVRAECGVGRQVAQLAAQAELYGPDGFDAAFAPEEIAIGTWHVLNRSGGILQGAAAGEMTRDGLARKASALGRQAFMGVPGYIEHVFARDTLDDINNQAENFVVYDVDAQAASALRARGGFAEHNAMAEDLWRLSQSMPRQGSRYFERLLVEREPALRTQLDPTQAATLARLDAIVADPFFSGFRIYVHRHGVTPIAYHFVRLLDRNPRTPFRAALALHNVHTTLMQRWFEHRLLGCGRRRGPGAIGESQAVAPTARAARRD
ncbi:MAG: hypothetical protein V4704_05485 [Pseudomonadota bacterium]